MNGRTAITATLLAAAMAVSAATAATVTIDDAATYQTIEGFGGFGPSQQWWKQPPFYSSDHLDLIVKDLGVTMLREHFYPDWEPTNDNADPNSTEISRFSQNNQFLQYQLPL